MAMLGSGSYSSGLAQAGVSGQAAALGGPRPETGIESIISRINVATTRVIDAAARAERLAQLTVGEAPGVQDVNVTAKPIPTSALDHLDDLETALTRLESHLRRMT